MTYEWLDEDTGRVVEVNRPVSEYDRPPDEPGNWKPLISIPAIGAVKGAGGTPGRRALPRKSS